MDDTVCPYCGAWDAGSCDYEDDTFCPWDEDIENENAALNAAIDARVERGQFARNGGGEP